MCYANALRKSEQQLAELLNPKLKGNLSMLLAYQPSYHRNAFTKGIRDIIPWKNKCLFSVDSFLNPKKRLVVVRVKTKC
jgi:hypothetical protein